VLGACGFIGRNLVKYLVDNKLVSKVKACDKQRPETSYFADVHKEVFANKAVVDYQQADLSKEATLEKIFKDVKFEYVFNCCGETRFGLSEQDYKTKCLDTAVCCATAAAKHGAKKFIELSTAQVYESTAKKSAEGDKLAPWTVQATMRLRAEEALKGIKDLPLVILRPAIVYGPADLTGLSPRITVAAVYQKLKKPMKFLWGKELKLNVVHVNDVVRAMWLAATEIKAGSVYNLADSADLDQGKLNTILGKMFGVEVDFFNSITSNLAKMNLGGVAEEANDTHVPGWQSICTDAKIANTPLSPFIDKELLYNNSLCIDGEKITKETSFKYEFAVNADLIREQIDFFVKQGLFPNLSLNKVQ